MGITQLNFEGKNKVEVAIEFIRAFEPPEGYYVAFSGGKDSVVIYDLVMKSGVKFNAHYNVSPIDPPELWRFIKEQYPLVQWDNYAKHFWSMVVKKGLPMRQSRWCCQVIKEAGGEGRVVVLGNRREEGTIRKHQKCFERHRKGKKMFLRPILDWNFGEVWEYIKTNSLPYCSLYDEGFKRLGCVLCPFARNTKQEIARFPKIANLWLLACNHLVEYRLTSGKEYKHQFKTGQELFDWWVSRK